MALSASLQKWLLNVAKMSPPEVLLIRFVPATIFLALYTVIVHGRMAMVSEPLWVIPSVGALGLAPAALMCSALVKHTLERFAIWQFTIPALCFLLTICEYKNNQLPLAVFSACIMLFGVVIMELLGSVPESQDDGR